MRTKLLIATPAYGGGFFDGYVISLVSTFNGLSKDQVDFAVYTLANESLINRARNKIANFVLDNKEFTHMIFIDADITWQYSDLRQLLLSDKSIVGGTYPMKTLPITLNFNPIPEHMSEFGHTKTMTQLQKYKEKYADKNGEVEVRHIPTGFMMIKREVFETLKDKVTTYLHTDYHTQVTSTQYEFFPVGVKDNILLSEDWYFCDIARANGVSIYFNTNIVTKHTGMFTFDANRYA